MKKNRLWLAVAAAVALAACSHTKTSRVPAAVNVKVARVEAGSEAGMRTYVGTVAESYGSDLSFASAGTVKSVLVDEGQAVRQGQTLAVLDGTQAQNSLDMALSNLRQAEDAYRRLSQLHSKGSLPDIKLVEIETKLAEARTSVSMARKGVGDCVLRAPFSGYISRRSVDMGNNVMPGVSCFKLVKLDRVEVNISVPENEVASIAQGQRISFTVAALGGECFTGTVTRKGVQADAVSHTYQVTLSLANPGHRLLPGMVCSASAPVAGAKAELLVPQEAIAINGSYDIVWVVDGGRAAMRRVTVGDVCNRGVAITSGLKGGEQVIVEGQNRVSEGQAVSVLK